jgi:type I restriction enzyme S subunit
MQYTIHCDYETSERAGAGGMFQVISLTDQDGVDCTHLVDVGTHYPSLAAVAKDIAKKTGKKPSEIELEEG